MSTRSAARAKLLHTTRQHLGVDVEYRSSAPGAPGVLVNALVRRSVGVMSDYGGISEPVDTVSFVRSELPAMPAPAEELVIRDGGEELRVVDKVLDDRGEAVVVALQPRRQS